MTRSALARPTFIAFATLVGLSACGDANPYRTFSVRDSAGVSIAENTGPVPEPGGWTLSPEPLLEGLNLGLPDITIIKWLTR